MGIPALEDKLLQGAVTQILLAIYEADFLPCSYGYRPGRGPHDAVRELTDELQWGKHNFVLHTTDDVSLFPCEVVVVLQIQQHLCAEMF